MDSLDFIPSGLRKQLDRQFPNTERMLVEFGVEPQMKGYRIPVNYGISYDPKAPYFEAVRILARSRMGV
jgi:hypothetical protein